MPKIKLLSEKSINQIAAGEVVERPLSVVKELIENSVDAGASKIKIEIENAGKNLIAIHDNGCGMTHEDLALAVERHATSKLDESKIEYINTLGFRGEALPSIASISDLRIISRAFNSESAYEISVSGGSKSEVLPASRDQGTSIEVRNLFSYTPARLKFLKSDRSERTSILNLVQSFALCYPAISFELLSEHDSIFSSYASGALDNQMITQIFGDEFATKMVALDVAYDDIKIKGFIGLPTFGHSSGNYQFAFVNGRIVKDKLITQAVRAAYYNLMAEGKHSAFIISIEMDPYEIDVNVHPAKTEIRFREPEKVRGFIIKNIRDSFKNSEHAAKPYLSSYSNYSAYSNENRSYNNISDSRVYDYKPQAMQTYSYSNVVEQPATQVQEEIDIEQQHHYLGEALFQIDDTYIVAKSESGIVIVDQHAAHERIVLEGYKSNISGIFTISNLLIPIVINVPSTSIDRIMEFKNQLKDIGFIVDRNGLHEVAVRGIPSIFDAEKTKDFINTLAGYIEENDNVDVFSKYRDEILGNIACHSSIRAGRKMNIVEMNALLRQIEKTDYSAQCNHGRPTFIMMNPKDLAKIFERT